ncbi:MAG TPA: hypothetical protein VD695_04545, partial [Gaiellaceae bacterium]|nr:hypothetical protein [Gaiellaceae bacterium]
MRALPATATAVLLLASGCGAEQVAYRSETSPPAVSGGSAERRAVMTEILAGLRPQGIEAVRIEPADAGWQPFPEGGVQ